MIFEVKLLEEEPAQIFPLVGADREGRALAREAFQRCDGARVWPAFLRYVRLVVDQELGEHLVEIVGAPSRRKVSSIMTRMPNPTPERTVAAATAAWPRRVSTWFSAWVRSGAVSTSVPSRSKTMVAPFSIGVLSHAPCGHASGGVESAG